MGNSKQARFQAAPAAASAQLSRLPCYRFAQTYRERKVFDWVGALRARSFAAHG